MANVPPLKLPITAEDQTRAAFAAVQANLARTQQAVKSLSAQMQAVSKETQGAGSSLAAVGASLSRIAPILSASFAFGFVKNIVNTVGGLGELADQLGVSTDALQALQAAAIQSGVGAEQLEAGIMKLARTVGDAVQGSDDAIDRFRQLGVGLLDASGKTRDVSAVFQDVAVAISGIEDPAVRAQMQFELFGKTGQRLSVMLKEIAQEGLDPMTARMKEAGAVADESIIKRFDEISDRAAMAWKQLVVFAANAIDAIVSVGVKASEAAQKVGRFFGLFEKPLDQQLAATEALLARQQALLDRMVSGGRANKRDIDEQTAAVAAYRKQVDDLRAAMAAPVAEPTAPTLPAEVNLPIGKRELEDQRKAADAAEKALADYIDRIRQTILSLDPATAAAERFMTQQMQLRDALEEGMISQERYTQLLAAAGDAYAKATEKVDTYGQSLDDLAQKIREQINPNIALERELAKIEELYQTGRISADEWAAARTAAQARLNSETEKTSDIARDLGLTFESAFEDAIVRGEKLRGVLGGIAQDLARIVIRKTVTERLAGFASSAVSGAGGWLASLLSPTGTMAGANAPWIGLPGFAEGGSVTGNKPIIVGEQGPELFVPPNSGYVVPNDQAFSGGGITVNQTVNISTGVAQTVRAEIAAMLPRIKRETVDAVADARMRGGSFAAAMGT